MDVRLVDERDINWECPLPVFRVMAWRNSGAHATAYDVSDATVSQVLDFARSEVRAGAEYVEVMCKYVVLGDGGGVGSILLERVGGEGVSQALDFGRSEADPDIDDIEVLRKKVADGDSSMSILIVE